MLEVAFSGGRHDMLEMAFSGGRHDIFDVAFSGGRHAYLVFLHLNKGPLQGLEPARRRMCRVALLDARNALVRPPHRCLDQYVSRDEEDCETTNL